MEEKGYLFYYLGVGLLQRVVRAPQAGQVRIAGEGKILYRIHTPDLELLAGMEGTVTNIIPERGAILETKGALIQGVWGNGKVTYGVVQPASNEMLKELVPELLNIGFRGRSRSYHIFNLRQDCQYVRSRNT